MHPRITGMHNKVIEQIAKPIIVFAANFKVLKHESKWDKKNQRDLCCNYHVKYSNI